MSRLTILVAVITITAMLGILNLSTHFANASSCSAQSRGSKGGGSNSISFTVPLSCSAAAANTPHETSAAAFGSPPNMACSSVSVGQPGGKFAGTSSNGDISNGGRSCSSHSP